MLHQNPIIRLFIPFITGIAIAVNNEHIQIPEFIPAAGVVLLMILILLPVFRPSYKFRWVTGLIVSLVMLFSGIFLTNLKKELFKHNHFSELAYCEAFQAEVLETPLEKPKSYKLILGITKVRDTSCWIPKSGKIIAYIQKSDRTARLKTGDMIIFKGLPVSIKNAGNPGEFDYCGYLARKGIFHQIYIRDNSWIKGPGQSRFNLATASESLRAKLLKSLEGNGISGDEFAVASAILLGYDDNIDPEIRKAYSGTGAMHILSVSGLHVGIIYAVLAFLLSFLSKHKNGPVFRSVFLIVAIWIYAFISGLSPATIRAATMFTFVSVGTVFRRKTPMYNTLAASALFILIVDPLLISDIGFQLSYVAVVGIVAIQPGLQKLLFFQNKIASYVWSLITVSIAAQAATFPLALLYFHQFPNYFLITNIAIIPISFVVMVVGIVFIAFSSVPFLGFFFGKLLSLSIFGMNYTVTFIEELPGSLTAGINISTLEMVLIYFSLITITIFFVLKRKSMLFATIATLCILFISINLRKIEHFQQKKILVCNFPAQTCLLLVDGTNMKVFADTLPSADRLQNIKTNLGIKTLEFKLINASTPLKNRFVYFKGKKILFCDRNLGKQPYSGKFNTDYVILSGNQSPKTTLVLRQINAKKIILGPTVPVWKAKLWADAAVQKGSELYDIKNEGTLIVSL